MAQRVLIEGCNLTLTQGTGIATYARNLNEAVRANGFASDLLVDINRPLDPRDPVLNEISLFDVTPPKTSPTLEFIRGSARWALPLGIRATNVQVRGAVANSPLLVSFARFDGVFAATNLDRLARYHFARHRNRAWITLAQRPSLFHATQAIAIGVRGCPNIYTIHDLVPLRLPFTTLDNKKYFLNLMRHLCRTADHIVTVSESSKQDIIKFFGIDESRITNTYQAVHLPTKVSGWSVDQVASIVERSFELPYQKYFLFVGAVEPKKNISRLIDAYAASGSKCPLVIAGGLGWQYDRDVEKIEAARFLSYQIVDNEITQRRQVRRLSYIPFEFLLALIRGARALLFPSLYEGFGLPVLEAMMLGTPVMTSNVTSLPEITGDAAILVDPLDIEDMTAAIRKLDSDEDLRADLAARGLKRADLFSPNKYRDRVAALYRRVLG
jgi:glycosyltransferase involved in cell wall biosynthesis